MAEQTTTEATVDTGENQIVHGIQVDDQGRAISEPEESSEEATAVEEQTTEPEQQTNEETDVEESSEQSTDQSTDVSSEEGEPSDDEQLARFAEAKGLTLDSDSAKKAAKMAMHAEKAMHAKSQKASELERASKITDEQLPQDVTTEQRDNVRMRNLELKFEVQQWKQENQDKLAHEADMVKVLSDPNKRYLVQEGYLNLDDVYSIAVGSNSGREADIKSQGKQEALKSLAQKQQAAVPTGSAVTSSMKSETITPENVEQLVTQNNQDWFEKHYDEINKAMAS